MGKVCLSGWRTHPSELVTVHFFSYVSTLVTPEWILCNLRGEECPLPSRGAQSPPLLFIDPAWSKTPLFSWRKNGAMLSTSYPWWKWEHSVGGRLALSWSTVIGLWNISLAAWLPPGYLQMQLLNQERKKWRERKRNISVLSWWHVFVLSRWHKISFDWLYTPILSIPDALAHHILPPFPATLRGGLRSRAISDYGKITAFKSDFSGLSPDTSHQITT